MKKTLFTLVLVTISIPKAAADGTVQFLNSSLSKVKYQEGPESPIVDAPIGTKIGLFWGTNPNNLTLVLPTATMIFNGVFNGGVVYPIPGTQPGQSIYVKFAGWDGSVGDHWSNSLSYGESSVVMTEPLHPPSFPSGTVIWQSATGTHPNRAKPFTIISSRETFPQSINFPELSERTFGDAPFQLNAVASSGLPVTYSSSDLSVARIDGSIVTIIEAGDSVITAFQAGTSNIRPATASRRLVVRKAIGLISVANEVQRFNGTAWVPTTVTVPPGLPVTLTFNGRVIPPAAVGRYDVIATIQSRNYEGSTNGLLTIVPRLSADTAGGGMVTVDPPAGAYFEDGTAHVTASPAPGWTFLQWLGDATGTNPVISVTMNHNRCLQAVFGTSLSDAVVGGGSVVRNSISALYPYGEIVQLTAVTTAGSYFDYWTNDATGTNNPLSFRVITPQPKVTAVFSPLPTGSHAVTVIPDGFGRVERYPHDNLLPAGTNVVLTALPEDGQEFVNWTGDASGANNPLVVSVTQSQTITARFTKRPRLSIPGCDVSSDEIQMLVTGVFGGRYVIESRAIPGESGWEPRGILETPFGAAQYLEPISRQTGQRVYRAVGE